MQTMLVKDVMIPLRDYVTVSEDAALYEAIRALKDAQKKFKESVYHHRAVLVYNADGEIVGKLSPLDVLRGLEPKFEDIISSESLDRYGVNSGNIRKMIKDLGLLKVPFDDICRIAADIRVRNIMYTPTEGEYVSETASLSEAVLLLVAGHHQSLLVTRDKRIVGILRLSDVFEKISDMIDNCKFA